MISIKDNRLRWAISGILALLILFGTYRNVFSLAAFLGCCLMTFFFDKESILLQLFFIMPMANIFKLSPGTQSFFTILVLLYVVLHLVLPRKATMVVIIFSIYIIVGQLFTSQFDFFKTVKLICNVLLLSSILNTKVQIRHREIFLSSIIGNLVASVFGTMNSGFFKVESYVGVTELMGSAYEEGTVRFKGLHSDPNYYAVGIIISLCLLVVLYHRKEINAAIMALLAAPMLYFLIITYSKSAILMIFVFCVFLLYSFISQKKYIMSITVVIMVIIVIILAIFGEIPIFETLLKRFSDVSSEGEVDINSLTTGRFDLWIAYIKHIVKNIEVALFGKGITAGLITHHVSHNTYIDIVYHLGIIGGLLLIVSLKLILSQSTNIPIKRNGLNYSVLICAGIMYFFLGELFYYDPPFHIFLAFKVMNLPLVYVEAKTLQKIQ